MRRAESSAVFVLGVLASGLGGWALGRGSTGPDAGAGVAAIDAVARPPAPPGPGTRARRLPANDVAPDLARAAADAVAGEGGPRLEAAARAAGSSPAATRAWTALLTVFAVGGRTDDFLRTAREALAAGADTHDLVDALRLLPPDRRADVLEALLAANTDVAWPIGDAADVLVEVGARDRAVALLAASLAGEPHRDLIERLVTLDPEHAASLLTKLGGEGGWSPRRLAQVADALVATGRADLATPFFTAALGRDPLDRRVLERFAAVDPDAALAHARRVVEAQGRNPAAWLALGTVHLATNGTPEAFEAFRQAALRGLSQEALFGMMRADPARAYEAALPLAGAQPDEETSGSLARLALAAGRPTEAVDALLRAHDLDPTDARWSAALVAMDPKRAADVLGARAQAYRGRQRDAVVGAFGQALLASGDASAAFEQYREAFELAPAVGAWQRGLAEADPARAIPLLEARRVAAGDKPDVLGALADAYAGVGRTQEARALYEQAAQRGGVRWYARMARVDPAGARARLVEVVAADPGAEQAWAALAECYALAGDAAAARGAYAKAQALNPANLTWALRAGSLASGTR